MALLTISAPEERAKAPLLQNYPWRTAFISSRLSFVEQLPNQSEWKDFAKHLDDLETILFTSGTERSLKVKYSLGFNVDATLYCATPVSDIVFADYMAKLRLFDIIQWIGGAEELRAQPKADVIQSINFPARKAISSVKNLFANLAGPSHAKGKKQVEISQLSPVKASLNLGAILTLPQRDPGDATLVKLLKQSATFGLAKDWIKVCRNFNAVAIYLLFLVSGCETFNAFLDKHQHEFPTADAVFAQEQEKYRNRSASVHLKRPGQMSDALSLGFPWVPVIRQAERILWTKLLAVILGHLDCNRAIVDLMQELPFMDLKQLTDEEDTILRLTHHENPSGLQDVEVDHADPFDEPKTPGVKRDSRQLNMRPFGADGQDIDYKDRLKDPNSLMPTKDNTPRGVAMRISDVAPSSSPAPDDDMEGRFATCNFGRGVTTRSQLIAVQDAALDIDNLFSLANLAMDKNVTKSIDIDENNNQDEHLDADGDIHKEGLADQDIPQPSSQMVVHSGMPIPGHTQVDQEDAVAGFNHEALDSDVPAFLLSMEAFSVRKLLNIRFPQPRHDLKHDDVRLCYDDPNQKITDWVASNLPSVQWLENAERRLEEMQPPAKTVHVAPCGNDDHLYPVRVIEFVRRYHDALDAKQLWSAAVKWLEDREKLPRRIKQDILQSLSKLRWKDKILSSEGSLNITQLTAFLSSNAVLTTVHINAMLSRLDQNSNNETVMIGYPELAETLMDPLLKQTEDPPELAILDKAKEALLNDRTIYGVLQVTQRFCAYSIQKSNNNLIVKLGANRDGIPESFQQGLHHFACVYLSPHLEVVISDTLTHGVELDAISCGILAINTLKHALEGKELWIHPNRDEIRAKECLAIIKNHLYLVQMRRLLLEGILPSDGEYEFQLSESSKDSDLEDENPSPNRGDVQAPQFGPETISDDEFQPADSSEESSSEVEVDMERRRNGKGGVTDDHARVHRAGRRPSLREHKNQDKDAEESENDTTDADEMVPGRVLRSHSRKSLEDQHIPAKSWIASEHGESSEERCTDIPSTPKTATKRKKGSPSSNPKKQRITSAPFVKTEEEEIWEHGWLRSRAMTPFFAEIYTSVKIKPTSGTIQPLEIGPIPYVAVTIADATFITPLGIAKTYTDLKFSSVDDATFFQEIIMQSQRLHSVDGLLPHVYHQKNPSEANPSVWDIISHDEYEALPPLELQRRFSKRHIMVTNFKTPEVEWKWHSIERWAKINVHCPQIIQDMSIVKGTNGRDTVGTFIDMMKCTEEGDNTKGLNSVCNSIPDSPHDIAGRLSTDWKAFKKVSFTPELTAQVPMPLWLIKIANGSTRGAITEWHQSADGAATVLDTYLGWTALAIARTSSECNARDSADCRRYREPHELNRGNCDTGDKFVEVIIVGPNTRVILRPNTEYAVFTLENSVVVGGYFYALSTMPDTLASLVLTLAHQKYITNGTHPDLRLMIHRVLQYVSEAMVLGKKTDLDTETHCPDRENLTMDDAKCLFALISFGVLSNVLDPRTYSFWSDAQDGEKLSESEEFMMNKYDYNSMSETERVGYVYTRGMAYELAKWFANNYELRPHGENIAEGREISTLEKLLDGVAYEAAGIYAARMRTRQPGQAAPNASLKRISQQLNGIANLRNDESTSIPHALLHDRIQHWLEMANQQDLSAEYNLLYDWDRFQLHKTHNNGTEVEAKEDWDSQIDIFHEGSTVRDGMYFDGLNSQWGTVVADVEKGHTMN